MGTGMPQPTAHVPAPEITVDATGTARSVAFDDVYFSARGGPAETEHVFLAGNRLPERWQHRARFTIGELGFGTGLNFLVAWKKFIETGDGHLHFISIEKFPLTPAQLEEALAHQPALRAQAQQLIAHYPLRLPGLHRLQFDRVTLTLGSGDVAELLPEIDAQIDAWFLDGFAPAKNDAMWSEPVLGQIARLSAPGATFATFTAAGAVKRGLQAVGFTVEKVQGYAHKRDMLVGRRDGAPEEKPVPRTAAVIGGGIAGCTAARALAERGLQVTLYEKDSIASGASGNPAAVLYPQLTKYYTPATQWHFSGYDFMLRSLRRWGFAAHTTGMLKIAKDDEDIARLEQIRNALQLDPAIARWVEADEGSRLLGQEVTRPGFWFPHGTWVEPALLCRALVRHPNIAVQERHTIASLGEVGAKIIVLANAQDANTLLEETLSLGLTAGQVSLLDSDATLDAILCHKGYTISTPNGLMTGATYDRDDLSGAVTQRNHYQNLMEMEQALPHLRAHAVGGRTAFRAATPSRLPYVGRLREGVYASVGHGSRGMISAALAAEVIAAQVMDEPSPVTRSLLRVLAPRRG